MSLDNFAKQVKNNSMSYQNHQQYDGWDDDHVATNMRFSTNTHAASNDYNEHGNNTNSGNDVWGWEESEISVETDRIQAHSSAGHFHSTSQRRPRSRGGRGRGGRGRWRNTQSDIDGFGGGGSDRFSDSCASHSNDSVHSTDSLTVPKTMIGRLIGK